MHLRGKIWVKEHVSLMTDNGQKNLEIIVDCVG